MRSWMALAFCVPGIAAMAAEPAPDRSAQLMNAAFDLAATPKVRSVYTAPAAQSDLLAALMDRASLAASPWDVMEASLAKTTDSGARDSLRLRIGAADIGDPRRLGLPAENRFEVTVTRNWPAAVSLTTENLNLDLTPHAGIGVGSAGGSAEAGATLTLGARKADLAGSLRKMGFKDGAATYGETGRWYVFAAASGRAVGLSLASKDLGGGWNRTQDSSSALISDASMGVGWRKGDVQTSLGYIHRAVKGDHLPRGETHLDDSMLAFSLSIKPGR